MISGTLLSVTAFACIFSSMLGHSTKISVLAKLNKHDTFMFQYANSTTKFKEIHKKVRKSFVCFWTMMGCCTLLYLASAYLLSPSYVSYAWQYEFVNLIIHFQSFQILIFAKSVEERLKILSELKGIEVDSLALVTVKSGLLQVLEIVTEINKCFGSSLLLIYFSQYGSVLSNFHWIGISLLGAPYASVKGFCCLLSN